MGEYDRAGQCTCNDPRCTVTHAVWQRCTKTENRAISFCAWLFFFFYTTRDYKSKISFKFISFIAFDLHMNHLMLKDNNELSTICNNPNCSQSHIGKHYDNDFSLYITCILN